ncbi:hypothetical protein KIPB_016357, partial [Kipferlia bialata]
GQPQGQYPPQGQPHGQYPPQGQPHGQYPPQGQPHGQYPPQGRPGMSPQMGPVYPNDRQLAKELLRDLKEASFESDRMMVMTQYTGAKQWKLTCAQIDLVSHT